MRAFILALTLALPLSLTACQSDTADDIEAQGDAIEEQYDEAAEAADEAIEDGAPVGDREDVIGDGEIIDEPSEPEM